MRTLVELHPLQQINQRPVPSLLAFIRNGGWFCQRCNRVVSLPLDLDEPARCPHCKKPTCKYHPPEKELQTT
jgi:rubrerythrin